MRYTLEVWLVVASLSGLACGATPDRVESPASASDRWNRWVQKGDCSQLAERLHPARYSATQREDFVVACEAMTDEQRRAILSVANVEDSDVIATLTSSRGIKSSASFRLEDRRWRLSSWDGDHPVATEPQHVLAQLRRLVESDELAGALSVMTAPVAQRYTEELRLLRAALLHGEAAVVTVERSEATIRFASVVINLAREDSGLWVLTGFELGNPTNYP